MNWYQHLNTQLHIINIDWSNNFKRKFFPHHSIVEDKKISGDKQSGSDMLGPKIGDRCPHF